MGMLDYEPRGIPEGTYTFTCVREVERRKHRSAKTGDEFVSIVYEFRAENEDGETYKFTESFLPWLPEYQDLLLAFGGTPDNRGRVSGQDIDPEGKACIADVKFESDRNNPDKKFPHMKNIRATDDGSKADKQEKPDDDGDVPF